MGGCDNNKIPQAGCGQDSGEALETGRVALNSRFGRVRIGLSGAGLSLLLALTGCGAFFQCEGKSDCGTGTGTGTGATGGDYVYVSNVPGNTQAISAYSIANGVLTPLTGSPYTLNPEPTAMVVAPTDSFLYVGSANVNTLGIYIYSLASTGVPSIANSGTPVNDGYPIIAMAISKDGNWLYTIEQQLTFVIQQYSVNKTTGLPTLSSSFALPGTASCNIVGSSTTPATAPCGIAVSPTGDFVIAAVGTAGDVIYPYNSTNGITSSTASATISAPSTTDGELSVAVDSSNIAYISETSSIASYPISSSGGTTSSGSVTSTKFTNGEVPRSITVSGSFVYTANQGTSSISAFSSASGALTSLASEISAPTSVSSIGVDNSGKYLVAAGFSSSVGVELYSITSSGSLTNLNQNEATGTNYLYPTVIALTH